MTQYPVLVYGTLRPTGGNYENLLIGHTVSEQDIRLDGFIMYGDDGCPFTAYGDREITATLIYIDEAKYDTVLKDLDRLEGYRGPGKSNLYDRVLHTFELEGKVVQAWIYLVDKDGFFTTVSPIVESGDWIQHTNMRKAMYA